MFKLATSFGTLVRYFSIFHFPIFGTNLAFSALRLLVSCPGDSSNNTPPDKINYQMNELKQMKPI